MKEKRHPLLTSERRFLFKKCLTSLDPSLALNKNFINNSFDNYVKRKNSKAQYMKIAPDKYRKIEGFINTFGTRVILSMKVSPDFSATRPIYHFNKRLIWNPAGVNNEKAIEIYKEFKEMSSDTRDNVEADEALRQHQREICTSLRDTLPITKETPFQIYISPSWSKGQYNISINYLTEEQTELILKTLRPLV